MCISALWISAKHLSSREAKCVNSAVQQPFISERGREQGQWSQPAGVLMSWDAVCSTLPIYIWLEHFSSSQAKPLATIWSSGWSFTWTDRLSQVLSSLFVRNVMSLGSRGEQEWTKDPHTAFWWQISSLLLSQSALAKQCYLCHSAALSSVSAFSLTFFFTHKNYNSNNKKPSTNFCALWGGCNFSQSLLPRKRLRIANTHGHNNFSKS